MDLDPGAKLNRLYAQYQVNNRDLRATDSGFLESVVRREIAGRLSAELAWHGLIKEVGEYAVTYSMNLYVMTPQQLEKYVQRRAERLSMGYPHVEGGFR